MGYDITLLLDGLILVFLCVTIFYAARLSLFMKSFRQGKSEMQRLVRELNSVIVRAESAVVSMKEHAGDIEGGMREAINEAKFLSDELKFMNETGDGLADRLEKLADRNRELVDLMENPSEPSPPREYVRTYDLDNHDERIPTDLERTFNIQDFDLDSVELDEDDEFDFLALSDGAYREEDALVGEDEDHAVASKDKLPRGFTIFDRDYITEDLAEDFADELANENSEDNGLDNDLDDHLDAYEIVDQDTPEFYSRAEQELFEALQRKKQIYDQHDAIDEFDEYEDDLDIEMDLDHSRVGKIS